MRPLWQSLTDPKQERSLRRGRPRCAPAVRLSFYASGRPTPQSTGVPNGVAVGYPRRFAPRHPVIAIVERARTFVRGKCAQARGLSQ